MFQTSRRGSPPFLLLLLFTCLMCHRHTALILIIVCFNIVGYISTARESKESGKGGKQHISVQASDTEVAHSLPFAQLVLCGHV